MAHQPSSGQTSIGEKNEPSPRLISSTQPNFAVPDCIKTDVDFWARIYREWDSHQVVVYDTPTKIIYDVINLPRMEFGLSSTKYKKDVEKRVKEITDALKFLVEEKYPEKKVIAKESKKLSAKQKKAITKKQSKTPAVKQEKTLAMQKIEDIVKKNSLPVEEDLVERVRFQNGLRSQFEYGLKVSGRYEDDMTKILLAEDLPDELLAIVFVESLFYPGAMSHKGAAGLWGIVKETALRSGIYVNNFTDERFDPAISTLGAARYFKKIESLISEWIEKYKIPVSPKWPLIVTAYNYGHAGILRALSNLQSANYCVIVKHHDGATFKYASKSYYPSVVAAIDTIKNQDKYFPGLKKDMPWQYELAQLERPVHVDDLIEVGAINREDITRLNPAFTKSTLTGNEVIPSDYSLRVPTGKSPHFYSQLKKIPQKKRALASNKISTKYVAKGRESLNAIAKLFGIRADYLSEKMKKPLTYKPVGPINIRSEMHHFFDKGVLSNLSANPPSAIQSLTEIAQPAP